MQPPRNTKIAMALAIMSISWLAATTEAAAGSTTLGSAPLTAERFADTFAISELGSGRVTANASNAWMLGAGLLGVFGLWRGKSKRQGADARRSRQELKRTMQVESLHERINFSAAFDLIGLEALRSDPNYSQLRGQGISVAVIDTAIDSQHAAFAGRIRGCNVVETGAACNLDVHRQTLDAGEEHGTHVAGIIGAANDDIGVAPEVRIIGLDVMRKARDGNFEAYDSDTEAALQWVLDNHREYNILAVNMSLGSGFYSSPLTARLTRSYSDEMIALEKAGVTIVSAAGNSYVTGGMRENSMSPGILSTLNVGAVYDERETVPFQSLIRSQQAGYDFELIGDEDSGPDRLPVFSQRPVATAANTIFAPGAMIRSTIPGNQTADWPGTSMAAPMVTGAVVLLQQAAMQVGGRYLAPEEVQQILRDKADMIFDGDDEESYRIGLSVSGTSDQSVTVRGQELPFRSTGKQYPRLNIHRAVQGVKQYFDSLQDPNATLADARGGNELWPPSRFYSRRGQPNVLSLQGNIGRDGTRNIGAADVDMYRLEIMSPGRLTANAGAANNGDAYLRLFNEQGSVVAQGNDRLSSISLEAGTYYIGISGLGNSNYNPVNASNRTNASWTGNYELTLGLGSADINGTMAASQEVLANQSLQRSPIGAQPNVSQRQSFNESILYDDTRVVGPADVDFFSFTATDDGVLLVDIDATLSNGASYSSWDSRNSRATPATGIDTFIRVLSADGTELYTNDDGIGVDFEGSRTECPSLYQHVIATSPGSSSCGNWSRFTSLQGFRTDAALSIPVQAGETYYIGISSFEHRNYEPQRIADRGTQPDRSKQTATTGYYRVTFEFSDRDLDGNLAAWSGQSAHDLALNELFSEYRVLGADAWSLVENPWRATTDRSDLDADIDLYAIRPTANGLLNLKAISNEDTALNQADRVDLALSLFDHEGQRLATSQSLAGEDPLLRYKVEAGSLYYVGFSHRENVAYDPQLFDSNFSSQEFGFYRASFELTPFAEVEHADESWNSRFRRTIGQGAAALGQLGFDRESGLVRGAGDVDGYFFTAQSTGAVRIATAGVDSFLPNTELVVLRSDNSVVARSNAAERLGLLDMQVVAGQTYLIQVRGTRDSTGNYALLVTDVPREPQTFVGDFDGDRRDDVLTFDGAAWRLTTAPTNGATASTIAVWSASVDWQDVQTGDFNGDGRMDVAGRANGQWWLGLSNGSQLVTRPWGVWSNSVVWSDVQTGDFNGDGRSDIAGRANGAWWLAMSNGSSFSMQFWTAWSAAVTWEDVQLGDFNGDGRDDIAGRTGGNWWVATSLGSTFTNQLWTTWANVDWDDVRVGDFNGDGRDDIAGRTGGNWWVAKSVANAFANEYWATWSTAVVWSDVVVGDFDNDGRDDLLGRYAGAWWLARGTSRGFVSSFYAAWADGRWSPASVGDFDGDSKEDLLVYLNEQLVVKLS